MAYKKVQSLETDITVKVGGKNKDGTANPTEVEGYFLGSESIPSQKAKSGFCKKHVFQTADGNIGVWGTTSLDRSLGNAVIGQMTLVTFKGMVKSKNGDMYTYTVQQDDENTIEVTANQAQSSSQVDVDEDIQDEPSAPLAPPAPPASVSLQDLLKKTKAAKAS